MFREFPAAHRFAVACSILSAACAREGAQGGAEHTAQRRDSVTLQETAKLVAPDGAEGDVFRAVALGNGHLLVGADYHANQDGAVYAFDWSGSGFVFAQELHPPTSGWRFGYDVRISGDAAVAVSEVLLGGVQGYLLQRGASGWSFAGEFTSPVGANTSVPDGVAFGPGVVMLSAAVQRTPYDVGVVRVFEWSGTAWNEQDLVQTRSTPPQNVEYFGGMLALSGNRLLVGCADWGNSNCPAWLFERGASSWTQIHRFDAPSSSAVRFGRLVAMDGTSVLIGADDGGLFPFTEEGGAWIAAPALPVQHPGVISYHDGTAVVSDYAVVDGGLRGWAEVWSCSGSTWSPGPVLRPADPGVAGHVESIAFENDTVVLGYGAADNGKGAAYVFSLAGWKDGGTSPEDAASEVSDGAYLDADDAPTLVDASDASGGAGGIGTPDGAVDAAAAGAPSDGAGGTAVDRGSTCGCRAPGDRDATSWQGLAAAMALLWVGRRRRL